MAYMAVKIVELAEFCLQFRCKELCSHIFWGDEPVASGYPNEYIPAGGL